MHYNFHYRSSNSSCFLSGRTLKGKPSYLRPDLLKDGITVVAVYNEEEKKLTCGFAVCSSKDRYEKNKGIEVAEQHLKENNPKYTFTADLDLSDVTTKSKAIESLISSLLPKQPEVIRLKGDITIIQG